MRVNLSGLLAFIAFLSVLGLGWYVLFAGEIDNLRVTLAFVLFVVIGAGAGANAQSASKGENGRNE